MNSITNSNPIQMLNNLIEDTASNIQKYCKNPGKDFIRNRKLPPQKLLKLILEMEGNSINAELFKSFPNIEERMSASAFIQQRNKLKPEVFHDMLLKLNNISNKKTFKGYQVVAIDGSDFYFPANPKSKCHVKNIQKCKDGTDAKDYCLLHANIMYDVLNKQYIDCLTGPKHGIGGNERLWGEKLIDNHVRSKQIVAMDRGYVSYNLIEHGNRSGGYYVLRSPIGNKDNSIPEIAMLPDKECDQWFNIPVTPYQRKKYLNAGYRSLKVIKKGYKSEDELTKKGKETRNRHWDFEEACIIRFRVIKIKINEEGENKWEVIITNLPSDKFSAKDIKDLYGKRWNIEISFRSLKYALGAIQFHSKQDDFVLQELYAHLIIYNIVAACGNEIELPNRITKYDYAVDFKMAVTVIRSFFKNKIQSFQQLCSELSRYIQPIRPGRKDPRKIKQKTPVYFIYRVA